MFTRLKEKLVPSKASLWKMALTLSASACVTLGVMLWLSGAKDTEEAFDSGRRVLMVRATQALVGKKNSTQPPKAEEVKKEEPKPEVPGTETPSPASPAEGEEKKPGEEPPTTEAPATEEPKQPGEVKVEEKPPAPAEGEEKKPEEKPVEKPAEAPPAPAKETKIVPGEELPMAQMPEDTDVPDESVTIVPSKNPLPDMNEKLVEKREVGSLPVIGSDGTKPWHYYAKPFDRKGKQPMIAIIITGLGHSKRVTEKALMLPENFTLSFSPYARGVSSWAATARLTAHEKMVDLPMEPSNYPASDPGPYGLIIDKGLQENENRLQWLMSRFGGHIGFVTPNNEVYTHNEEALKVLLQSLANRGLMLVLAHEPAKTETKETLDTSSTANIISDMLVDEELLDTAIQTRLVALEQIATRRGFAVGIATATPLSIEQLRQWSDTLESKGIILVPVSAIAKLRFS